MDGYHENCRVHYRDWYEPETKIHECECECHQGKPKPKLEDRTFTGPDVKKSGKRKREEDLPAPTRRTRRKKGSG